MICHLTVPLDLGSSGVVVVACTSLYTDGCVWVRTLHLQLQAAMALDLDCKDCQSCFGSSRTSQSPGPSLATGDFKHCTRSSGVFVSALNALNKTSGGLVQAKASPR